MIAPNRGCAAAVANQLGAGTVAVGVETEADFLMARELGFDLIQGFLFAKPMGVRSLVRTTGAT